MAKPIIALLSDFGTRDHYVGVMRGVILGICPEATLVDVSNDLPAHDISVAALELAATYKFFPAGTIFLTVVDPGVGTQRRGIAAEAGEWRFVAPDNGVLTGVFVDTPPKKVVELTERRYARPTMSRTFEGRERFAPVAANLSRAGPPGPAPMRTTTGRLTASHRRFKPARSLRPGTMIALAPAASKACARRITSARSGRPQRYWSARAVSMNGNGSVPAASAAAWMRSFANSSG